jgi:uncharacterized protein (DUF2236 family)
MTWSVVADTSVFVGGLRALIIQAAHPEVVAGVEQHSRYREDPLGRLGRTAAYVTATAFGARPEVEAALDTVRRRHRPVSGISERGEPYSAEDPALAAWVHNTLTDSFLVAYRVYGGQPCSTREADRYVAEQTRVGELLGASPLPVTAEGLSAWIERHPDLARTEAQREAIHFLRRPPIPLGVRAAYQVLFRAAAATVPRRIQRIVGVGGVPGDVEAGRAIVGLLRWSLGASPDLRLALARSAAAPPPGIRFRRRSRSLPAEALEEQSRNRVSQAP